MCMLCMCVCANTHTYTHVDSPFVVFMVVSLMDCTRETIGDFLVPLRPKNLKGDLRPEHGLPLRVCTSITLFPWEERKEKQ